MTLLPAALAALAGMLPGPARAGGTRELGRVLDAYELGSLRALLERRGGAIPERYRTRPPGPGPVRAKAQALAGALTAQ